MLSEKSSIYDWNVVIEKLDVSYYGPGRNNALYYAYHNADISTCVFIVSSGIEQIIVPLFYYHDLCSYAIAYDICFQPTNVLECYL